MISVYRLKPLFQKCLMPIVKMLAARNVTANQVTLAALLLSVAVGLVTFLFADKEVILLLLPFALLVRMALNAIDGLLARHYHMTSPLGAILNETGDVLSDIALYLPLCFVPAFSPVLVTLIIVFAVVGEFIGILSLSLGGTRRYDGPMGKSDRAFAFGVIGLCVGMGWIPLSPFVVNTLLIFVLGLSIWTCSKRAHQAINEAEAAA